MFRRPSYFFTCFLIWLGLEVIAFWSVVQLAGLFGAFLLAVSTTAAGVLILRNLGRGAAQALRQSLEGKELASGKMLDGALTALGAALLILPGFISDLAGLALAAPSLRQWLARRFGGKAVARRTERPEVIELGPGEWAAIDGKISQPVKARQPRKTAPEKR